MASSATEPFQQPDKSSPGYIEEKDPSASSDHGRSLSEAHKAYLIERHGTFDLDPVPSPDPADPYNWPLWKVSRLEKSSLGVESNSD